MPHSPRLTRRTAALSLLAPTLTPAQRARPEIRGMYSNPKPFWDTGARLDEYGINAIFVHAGSINDGMIARAKNEGARVFAEFPTLNGKGYVEKHPEAWPINEKGEPSPAATWFLGACPTEPGFRAMRMKQLDDLLDRFDVAGVWMDYFHWHAQFEDPHPILPETCFSPTCIASFAAETGIKLPQTSSAETVRWILARHERRWREWRVGQLEQWAGLIREKVRRKRPGALVGVYHCPWTDSEYGGARRRILGLDLKRLAKHVDVLSPMVYHGRMERRPEWVGEYVKWLSSNVGKSAKIWPIVQATNEPRPVSGREFETVLRQGLSGSATGVMMFTAQAVASDREKMEAMRQVYGGGS